MDSFGFFWILLDSFGFFWIHLDSFEIFWILLEFFEFFRNLLDSFGIFWSLLHTGVLDLSIISNDTILLKISIPTTFALQVTSRVSNDAKFFQKIKFYDSMCCFSVRIEKPSKMSKIQPKIRKKRYIFKDFPILTEKQRMKP